MQWTIETPDGPRALALRMPTQLEVLEFRGAQTEWPDHPGGGPGKLPEDATAEQRTAHRKANSAYGTACTRWLRSIMPCVMEFLRTVVSAEDFAWLVNELPPHVTFQLANDIVAAREVPADTLGKFGVSRK